MVKAAPAAEKRALGCTCWRNEFIWRVPVLQSDPSRAEDLDTNTEDHIADGTRYACLSRLLAARATRPPGTLRDLPGWRCDRRVESWKAM